MTKAYNYAKTYGNTILYRGYRDGKTVLDRVPFKPTLYELTSDSDAVWRDIYNKPLEPVRFGSIKEAREHVNQYKEVSNYEIFGNLDYAIQYLKEEFPGKIDADFRMTKIFTLDIETSVNFGFPDYMNPMEEILLISVKNLHEDRIITFSSRPTKKIYRSGEFVLANDEAHLLKLLVMYIHDEKPDVFSGWNVEGFDMPYLASRIEKIIGEEWAKKISPFGIYRWREIKRDDGSIDKMVSFYGISVLDYMNLYKKFGGSKHEEWSLNFVASFELEAKKLENPHETFQEFYTKDWDLFVEYNRIDVELVDRLEKKLKLLELATIMSYRAKCNFEDVLGTVKMWDCKIHDYLLDRKVALPNPKKSTFSGSIAGAYVKEPLAGRYEWEVSVDAESLYPCIMMGWNISPDTIINGMMDSNVDLMLTKGINMDLAKKQNFCMTANGAKFTKNKRGFIPAIIEAEFGHRKKTKNNMLELESQLEAIKKEIERRK